ncbi:hypothetical protein JXM67_04985 [candidate division WOR-3 bacterium]|nr:hypothetical protein [candidate division WOR-3 bacterium]
MKIKKVLTLAFIGMLVILGCDIIDDLKKGVSHTASRINSIQAIGDSKEFAFVDIEYVFTGTGVGNQKAVFSREDSDKADTMDIALAGTFYTDIDTLKSSSTYTYDLSLLNGTKLTAYDKIEVKTLPLIEITHPADTFFGDYDPVEVKWDKISYDGEDYLTYEVALYDASELDFDDPDLEDLLALSKPLEGPIQVTLDAADTEGSYTFEYASALFVGFYVVKVTTNKALFDKLANKSTTFKPFVWCGPPPK